MNGPKYPLDEIAERGEAIYAEKLRMVLEPEHIGKVVIIDIESGDYEVDADEFAASKRVRARCPDGEFYGMRVGYRAFGAWGASMESLRR